MFPQEAKSKYKDIITGYGVNETSKGFLKAQEDNKQF